MLSNDLADFARDGYVLLPSAVKATQVQLALAAIRSEWRRVQGELTSELLARWTERTFLPETAESAEVVGLFTDSVYEFVSALLSPRGFEPPVRAQIAIRLGAQHELSTMQSEKNWHCDGVYCPHLPDGELRTFEVLVGVLLTDIKQPADGALVLQPGGHLRMAEFFRKGGSMTDEEEVPVEVLADQGFPVLGRAGDVVVAHHLVPHRVGASQASEDRIVVYFRIKGRGHDDHVLEGLQNAWVHMPTLSDLHVS